MSSRGGAHQHPSAAAQAPVDLTGEQLAGLLQGAAGIEQPIHALPHLPVQVGHAAVADVGWRFDFPRLLLVAHIDTGARHGLHHPIRFQLAVYLADGVAMQAGLHGQLPGARQAMTRGVMPRCDGEADLVVKLGRRRYVAFLLDVESHAGGPDQDAATIRTESPGDNWVRVLRCCDNFAGPFQRLGFDCQSRRRAAVLVGGRRAGSARYQCNIFT